MNSLPLHCTHLLRPLSTKVSVAGIRHASRVLPPQAKPSLSPENNFIIHERPIRVDPKSKERPQNGIPPPSIADSLAAARPEHNSLLAPVHIPEDQNAVLKSDHPSTSIVAQPGIVVERQCEMQDIFLGHEKANRYLILNPKGLHIGSLAEYAGGGAQAIGRQMFRTHRAFTTHVFDRRGKEVLRVCMIRCGLSSTLSANHLLSQFDRPFAFTNSCIRVYDAASASSVDDPGISCSPSVPVDSPSPFNTINPRPLSSMRMIGEIHQQWALSRRKYNLFLRQSSFDSRQKPKIASEPYAGSDKGTMSQFAYVDSPFLSMDFALQTPSNRLLGSVNRKFAGIERQNSTNIGVYALRMDSATPPEKERGAQGIVGKPSGMTLDQRAVMLAAAVSIDFDYFSRTSSFSGDMTIPMWLPFGGAEEVAGGAAVGELGGLLGWFDFF